MTGSPGPVDERNVPGGGSVAQVMRWEGRRRTTPRASPARSVPERSSDHSPGGEAAAGQPQGVPHLLHPAERNAVRFAGVVERNDLLLEEPVELGGVGGIGVLALARGRDGPAAQSVVALLPPSVKRAQLRNPVERRLHAARAGGLERDPGQVEPQVHPLHQQVGQVHVVVFEEGHAALELGVTGELIDALEDFLAGIVGGVRLAGEDDLHRPPGIDEEAAQAIEVAEDQVGTLVRGESPRKADRQRGRVEQRAGADHLRGFLELVGKPAARVLPDEVGEDVLEADVRVPELGGGRA